MPDFEVYDRQSGPIPALDGLEPERRQSAVAFLHQVAFLKLLLEHHDGHVILTGLGPADADALVTRYEIAMRGLGSGRIELKLFDKEALRD